MIQIIKNTFKRKITFKSNIEESLHAISKEKLTNAASKEPDMTDLNLKICHSCIFLLSLLTMEEKNFKISLSLIICQQSELHTWFLVRRLNLSQTHSL